MIGAYLLKIMLDIVKGEPYTPQRVEKTKDYFSKPRIPPPTTPTAKIRPELRKRMPTTILRPPTKGTTTKLEANPSLKWR